MITHSSLGARPAVRSPRKVGKTRCGNRRARMALYGVSAVFVLNTYVAAQSVVIASYLFTGNSAGDDTHDAPTGEATNANFGTMTRTGVTTNGASNVFNSSGFNFAALDTGKYVGFSISANNGFQVNVASISFDYQRSNSGPTNLEVRTSGDGFNNPGFDPAAPTTTTQNAVDDFNDFTVTAATPGGIRWYAWNASAVGGTFRLDNIIVWGSVSALPSSAQYWDLNGNASGIGGTGPGTWDNSSPNWNPQSDGTGTTTAYNPSLLADFGGTPGAVNIASSGVVSNGGLQFDVSGYTISDGGSGGQLTLGTTPSITVSNATDTGTISAAIAGSNGLSKLGQGTLVLTSSASNFDGAVNVAAGALQITSDGALGDAPNGVNMNGGTLVLGGVLGGASINANRTFTFNLGSTIDTAGADSMIAGPLDGTGAFTKAGNGKLTLQSAANAGRSGATTTINGGTVRIENAAALGAGGSVAVNSGAALEFGSVTVNSTAGNGGFGLTLNNGATLVGTGSSTYSVSNSPSLASNASITLTTSSASDVFEIGSAIRNGGSGAIVNVNGPGTVFVSSGATTSTAFSGQWNVNLDPGGILHLGSTNSFGNNSAAMASATINNGIVAVGGFTPTTGVVIPNAITINGGTLGVYGGIATSLGYSGQVTVTSGQSVAITSTDVLDNSTPRTMTFYKRINAGGGSINVYGNGTIVTSGVNAGSLSILSGTMAVAAGRDTTNKTSTVNNLSITPGAALDLADNDLVYDYSHGGTADPAKLTAVRNLLASGYASGTWTGNGITSSVAATVAANNAANPGSAPQTAIGYAEASSIPGLSSFDSISTDSDMIVMRYTLSADATLDGTVNSNDFAALAANYGATNASWAMGDFNYDGTVNALDFNLLATNYGATPISSAVPDLALPGALVPEPATMGSLLIGGFIFAGQRRNRKNIRHR